jgi:hypothetical protein
MRDLNDDTAILKLLRLLSDHLEGFVEGDDFAFDTLGEAIEASGYGPDDIQAAILLLRGFGSDFEGDGAAPMHGSPGKRATRI